MIAGKLSKLSKDNLNQGVFFCYFLVLLSTAFAFPIGTHPGP